MDGDSLIILGSVLVATGFIIITVGNLLLWLILNWNDDKEGKRK